jgi:hypothetical protein
MDLDYGDRGWIRGGDFARVSSPGSGSAGMPPGGLWANWSGPPDGTRRVSVSRYFAGYSCWSAIETGSGFGGYCYGTPFRKAPAGALVYEPARGSTRCLESKPEPNSKRDPQARYSQNLHLGMGFKSQ